MEPVEEWPELTRTIEVTRAARDRSAQAAQKCDALGIPTLGADLAKLAATYDRLLANLLYLERTTRDLPRP